MVATKSKLPDLVHKDSQLKRICCLAFLDNGKCYQVALSHSEGNLIAAMLNDLHGGKVKILKNDLPLTVNFDYQKDGI